MLRISNVEAVQKEKSPGPGKTMLTSLIPKMSEMVPMNGLSSNQNSMDNLDDSRKNPFEISRKRMHQSLIGRV